MKSKLTVLGGVLLFLLSQAAFAQSLDGAGRLGSSPGLTPGARNGPADLPDPGARFREGLGRAAGGQSGRPTLELPPRDRGRRGEGWTTSRAPGRPPLEGRNIRVVRYAVNVSIVDGVAITEIDQTFHNNAGFQVEGIYTSPLPRSAVVLGFSIFQGNRWSHGTVMDRTEGRRIYDRITRRARDPGLVEVAGKSGIQTRIFPIPAHGDMRVSTRYAHVLERSRGRFETKVPVRAITKGKVDEASFEVHALSAWPIALDFTRGFAIRGRSQSDWRRWTGGFVAKDFRAGRDLEIRCMTGSADPSLTLRVHRAADGQRYFMAVVAAGPRDLRAAEVTIEGAKASDVYPMKIRSVPKGRFVHVFGLLECSGNPVAVLRARSGGEPVEARATAAPMAGATAALDTGFVARIWAQQRVNEILAKYRGRKLGPEAKEIVVELCKRHGILTEYTAILAR